MKSVTYTTLPNEPICYLNYPFDKTILLKEAEQARLSAKAFNEKRGTENRTPQENFKIAYWSSPYILKIIEDLGVNGKPRFYFQEPNTSLDMHKDINTLCAVNILLNDNPSPITFINGSYFYEQALINTQVPHTVYNGPNERILFKISIFDQSFEEVSKKINFKA